MFSRDFKEFAELLDAKGVESLRVGGDAPAAHRHPRYTGDNDAWVRPAAHNPTRPLDALEYLSPPIRNQSAPGN